MTTSDATVNAEFPGSRDRFAFLAEKAFTILCVLVWTRQVLVLYFRCILVRLPFFNLAVNEIVWTIFAVILFLAIPCFAKRLRLVDILFFFFCVSVFLYYSFRPYDATVDAYLSENKFTFLSVVFPAYLLGAAMRDDSSMLHWLHIASIGCIIIDFIALLFFRSVILVSEKNMGFAYWLLPHVVFVILFALREKNTIDILSSLLGVVFLLGMGTRGPFVCIASAILLFGILYRLSSISFGKFLCLAIASLLLFVFWNQILLFLNDVIRSLGMSSRILDYLLMDSFADMNGRDIIRDIIVSRIVQNPYGYGLAADRSFVIAYSHNIALEFWVSFGVFTGTILLLFLICLIVRAFIKTRLLHQDFSFLILALFSSMGFVGLLMSSSFLREASFFLMVGVCVGGCRTDHPSATIS